MRRLIAVVLGAAMAIAGAMTQGVNAHTMETCYQEARWAKLMTRQFCMTRRQRFSGRHDWSCADVDAGLYKILVSGVATCLYGTPRGHAEPPHVVAPEKCLPLGEAARNCGDCEWSEYRRRASRAIECGLQSN